VRTTRVPGERHARLAQPLPLPLPLPLKRCHTVRMNAARAPQLPLAESARCDGTASWTRTRGTNLRSARVCPLDNRATDGIVRTIGPDNRPGAAQPRTQRGRGRTGYRYWPVFEMVSIARPASLPLPPETNVRMYTIRSPFLPEIRAQSSGFVVLGRSSFSRNSSTHAACR
jgi:hypothetical protein